MRRSIPAMVAALIPWLAIQFTIDFLHQPVAHNRE